MKRYLLYTDQQVRDYQTRHRDFIARKAQAYARWVNSLPFWTWTPLMLPQGQEEAILGLLCLLHIKNRINLTINETLTAIQRNPLTPQEYAEATKHLKI
ncbi:MAG: hypothetical protein IKK28_03860 [Mogibacterium sp.]|nr:hypothetical protein [Mogibacterium sp.]